MATVFTALRKSSTATLSGGNLTVTVATSTAAAAADRIISGPTYGEYTIGASLTGTIAVGFCNGEFAFTTTLLGANLNSLGYDQAGAVKINNVTLSTIQTFAATDRIGWAINPATQLVWFRKNNGNWNNDVIANQDPAAGLGGISTATLQKGVIIPAVSATAVVPNQAITAKFSTPFTDTAPTGFVTVDTIQPLSVYSEYYAGPAYVSNPSLGAVRSSFSVNATIVNIGTAYNHTSVG